MIAFTVFGVPIPQGSMKAFMRPGMRFPVVTADNKRTKSWRQAVVDAAREQLADASPLEGPVGLGVEFFLPRPRSAKKDVVLPAKKPDLDKLVRAIGDALTAAGVWRDDSQVVSVGAWKVFAASSRDPMGAAGIPRCTVRVEAA